MYCKMVYALRSSTILQQCLQCKLYFESALFDKASFALSVGVCTHYKNICNYCVERSDGKCFLCDTDIYTRGISECESCGLTSPLGEAGCCGGGEYICSTCFMWHCEHGHVLCDECEQIAVLSECEQCGEQVCVDCMNTTDRHFNSDSESNSDDTFENDFVSDSDSSVLTNSNTVLESNDVYASTDTE